MIGKSKVLLFTVKVYDPKTNTWQTTESFCRSNGHGIQEVPPAPRGVAEDKAKYISAQGQQWDTVVVGADGVTVARFFGGRAVPLN